jgi:fructose/tagatose bisphosphate aldolase
LLSDPRRVGQFVERTGVDLVVPNLGTEHRTASDVPLEYRRDIAREISKLVGPIQALHGTSSLGDRLETVGSDDICKVNFYTALCDLFYIVVGRYAIVCIERFEFLCSRSTVCREPMDSSAVTPTLQ